MDSLNAVKNEGDSWTISRNRLLGNVKKLGQRIEQRESFIKLIIAKTCFAGRCAAAFQGLVRALHRHREINWNGCRYSLALLHMGAQQRAISK